MRAIHGVQRLPSAARTQGSRLQDPPGATSAPDDDAPDRGGREPLADAGIIATPPPPPVRQLAVVLAVVLPVAIALIGLLWTLAGGSGPTQGTEATTSGESLPQGLQDGVYALWARNADESAVRWDACQPIRWVFNPDGAPLGASEQFQLAIDRVAEVTGLDFAYIGETDELPRRDRESYQPDRYGRDVWSPVLISWRTPETTDVPLSEHDRAVAIPVAVGTSEVRNFVTAQIIFNRKLGGVPGFDDRRSSIGVTMLHELLHVVGLQHVDDPVEMMFPFPVLGDATFGPGDLAGMREVGAANPCLPTPTPKAITVEYQD
ncbi:MAG: hypothetical protein ACI867_000672 [Glaciecola sp.]